MTYFKINFCVIFFLYNNIYEGIADIMDFVENLILTQERMTESKRLSYKELGEW